MGILDYQEFVVPRLAVGRVRAIRVALLALYTVPALLLCGVLLWYLLFPAIPAVLLVDAILVWLTWPMTRVEFEYATDGSVLRFAVIRGGRYRREALVVPIRSFSSCIPVADGDAALAARFAAADKRYDFRSSPGAEAGYGALFTDASGRRCAVFFDGFAQLIEVIRFRNSPATVVRDGLPRYE